jgi:DinB family protein
MNASDVLKYGHRTVVQTIEGLPQEQWETSGVCGVWSTKNIIAHLASYEHVLVDILSTFLDGGPTPTLDQFRDPSGNFNDRQVDARKNKTAGETLAEYNDAHTQVMALAARIPAEVYRQSGSLPWYGIEYALDDLIVYQYYGHKREHSAQIAVFLDRLAH